MKALARLHTSLAAKHAKPLGAYSYVAYLVVHDHLEQGGALLIAF
jgi:hypothetical protein